MAFKKPFRTKLNRIVLKNKREPIDSVQEQVLREYGIRVIPIQEITSQRTIGRGSFGAVQKATLSSGKCLNFLYLTKTI